MGSKNKLKPALSVEDAVDFIFNDMTHTCDGWAKIHQAPIFFHENSIDNAHKAVMIFSIPQYNREDKKFKMTIEEL